MFLFGVKLNYESHQGDGYGLISLIDSEVFKEVIEI